MQQYCSHLALVSYYYRQFFFTNFTSQFRVGSSASALGRVHGLWRGANHRKTFCCSYLQIKPTYNQHSYASQITVHLTKFRLVMGHYGAFLWQWGSVLKGSQWHARPLASSVSQLCVSSYVCLSSWFLLIIHLDCSVWLSCMHHYAASIKRNWNNWWMTVFSSSAERKSGEEHIPCHTPLPVGGDRDSGHPQSLHG